MSHERRRHIRSPARLMAFVKNVKTGKVERCLTKNLSGTGLCYSTKELVELDTRLELEIKLPDFPNPILMNAEVIWVRTARMPAQARGVPDFEVGIEFIGLPQKTKAVLDQYAVINTPPDLK